MPSKYANANTRRGVAESVRGIEKMLEDPSTAGAVRRKDRVIKGYQQDKEMLQRITPPDFEDNTSRKQAVERMKALEVAMRNGDPGIGLDPMPSKRAMWDTPAGAVGQETRWQNAWKNHTLAKDNKTLVKSKNGYGGVFEWKDLRRQLLKEAEAEDGDIANIETFRPDTAEKHNLADYASRSFSLASRMTQEEYDQLFPDHQDSDVEKKIREAETTQEEAIAAESYSDTPQRCRAMNARGSQCGNTAVQGHIYCSAHRSEDD